MTHASFNPGFPVLIYEEGLELPKEGTYFLVAGNGCWLHKDTGIVRCFVPVDNISVLQDLKADIELECKLPKLPARDVARIKEFFRRVVEKHRSEASTTLFFNKKTNEYFVQVPEQTVSHGGVNYKRVAITHMPGKEDFLRVGTIHSHCDFDAFHSGTDIGDEVDFDGLHCTFGFNDKEDFTISASVVVNGRRMLVEPADVLEGIESIEEKNEKRAIDQEDKFFRCAPVDEAVKTEWFADIEAEWMSKVSARSFAFEDFYKTAQAAGKGFKRFGHMMIPPFGSSAHLQTESVKPEEFAKGDTVSWAGDLNSCSIKSTLGEGPFEVLEVERDRVTIKTASGDSVLSSKMFKKEQA